MTARTNNEWLLGLDDIVPCDRVVELPSNYTIDAEDPDFATSPESYATRVTAARLHVRACDGSVRPRRFATYAAALAAARAEFAEGEASFDGIRAFDGISVQVGTSHWWPVHANLGA